MSKKVLWITLSVFTVLLLLAATVTIKQFSDKNNLNAIKLTNELPEKVKSGIPTQPKSNVQNLNDSKLTSDNNGNISKGVRTAQKSTSGSVDSNITEGAADSVILTVSIAVVGKNQEIIYRPSEVSVKSENAENVTVLNVLAAAGINYETSSRWPGLVEVIGGLKNKGQSGWMYAVNDQIPMVSAAAKEVQSGDRIIWWYSEDIKSKFPAWKDLTATNQSTP